MKKSRIRTIALQQDFVNAKKHDSQDICFVRDGKYSNFIETYTGQ
jgi:tRNA-specific 2-thiouridylase